ncbi:MAG: hypothetical protein ACYC6X_02385 [Minisyncoccota bacterium]
MTNNTMNNQSNIERVVMRRVHTIRILRLLFSNGALAIGVFALALWGIGREVWVAHVLQNAPKDLADLPRFYIAAFDHTRLTVQALTLLTLVALIYSAREFVRALSTFFTLETA